MGSAAVRVNCLLGPGKLPGLSHFLRPTGGEGREAGNFAKGVCGLRRFLVGLLVALLSLCTVVPAAQAIDLPPPTLGSSKIVRVTPDRFLAGGDPDDFVEIEFSAPPGGPFGKLDIWKEPRVDFVYPAGTPEGQRKVRWELNDRILRVYSPGTGGPGGIVFGFERAGFVRVAVAGDYIELTPARFLGDGRVVLKAQAWRWPGGPPAVGEELVVRVVIRGNVGEAVKEGHLYGYPITLGVSDRAKTDSQGVAYLTIRFYQKHGKVWVANDTLDQPLDLKPDRKASIVAFSSRAEGIGTVLVSFQKVNEEEQKYFVADVPVKQDASALINEAVIPTLGPGGVSNPILITQDFLDRVFGQVRVVDTSDTPPPTDNLPDGTIIDRQPGYAVLARPVKLDRPGEIITLAYDQSKLTGGRRPSVYYWHPQARKWVGLASYPAGPGKVKAVNRGYSGWFTVFGIVRPEWTDTGGHWATQTADRANVLGLLEGYPPKGKDPLLRPAGLDRKVTRAEFTAIVARVLGMNPGDLMYSTLKPLPPAERDRVLAQFKDTIPAWAREAVAAAVAGGIAVVRGDRYNADEPLTRIEAAAIVSNALKQMPGWRAEDLARFRDAKDVPAWAKGMIAEGVIGGYPDNTLRPNATVTRAEALTLVLRLLEALGW